MLHDSSYTVVLFNMKTGQYKVFIQLYEENTGSQLESKYFRAFIDESELSIKPVLSLIIYSAGLILSTRPADEE